MQVPDIHFRRLIESAVVVILVIALLQYFGGIMVEASGQVDLSGLATIGVLFVVLSAVIAVVTANTSLPTPDWVTKIDE